MFKQQYVFIYEALLEALHCGDTVIAVHKYDPSQLQYGVLKTQLQVDFTYISPYFC